MAKNSCIRCGHIFYNDIPDENGICHYCNSDPIELCYICQELATCSGDNGYKEICNLKDQIYSLNVLALT